VHDKLSLFLVSSSSVMIIKIVEQVNISIEMVEETTT